MPSPLHTPGYFNEPTAVEHSQDEKNVTFAAEMADAGSDSNINPGGLTFEEGLSLVQLCFQDIPLTCEDRYCRWDGSPSGCLQLYDAQVTTPPHPICQYLRCDQRGCHHRHWYILHSIDHPRVCRVYRCILDALGPWLRPLVLRALCLARVWHHVSTVWRRKGVP